MQIPMNQSDDSVELSKMFHEIKNSLTLINSSLQLIESDHPEVKAFRFWNQTMKDLAGLRLLINDLSSLHKSSFLNIKKINLFDFTEDLLETVEAFLLEKGTPLILENTVDDLDFYADDVKLRQAIINLLKNASESCQQDSPILLRITADEKLLSISVTDQGCGIKASQMEHLFEPFYTTKSYGTGLGLPMIRRIVEAHNGTLSLQSVENTGTTFCISIPVS